MLAAPIAASSASSLAPDLIAIAVEAAGEVILMLERRGDRPDDILIRGANTAFQALTGYSGPELLGQPLTLLFATHTLPPDLMAALRAGVAQRTEMICQRRDGQSCWMRLHLVPVPQAGPGHFIMLGQDTTRRHHKEEEHHAVEGLLAKVFLSVEAGVVIVSTDGILLMANPCIHHLLRMPPAAMVGRSSLEFVVPADRDRLAKARERQLVEGGKYTVSVSLLAADETEIPVSLTATVVAGEDLSRFRVLTILPTAPGVSAPAATAPVPPPLSVRVAGKVQLVGLDEVKAALGDDWPRYAQRAMETAEHVLRQSCGPNETFARSGASSFVVCFAKGTEQEAAFRAAMIARDIRSRLIGRGDSEAASHVSAVTATVPLPVPEPQAAMLSELLAAELTRRTSELEAAARACLAQAALRETYVVEPVHARSADQPTARILRLAHASEHRIAAALAALPEQEASAFDLDGLLLDLAVTELTRLAKEGDRSLVMLDVRFSVFSSRVRTERYLAHCKQLAARFRKGLMVVLVLTELPPGASGTRLLDCAARLKPFCAGIGFQADTMALPFADLSFTGTPIVVAPAETCGPPGVVLPKLRRLITTVHTHRGRLLIRGVADWAAAEPLLAAGADMVSLASLPDQPPAS
jgi:PAS domain S-box-containing protein